MDPDKLYAVILAAGRGKRMNSTHTNKVALEVNGKPMIQHTIDNLHLANINNIVVVVGFAKDSVLKLLDASIQTVEQPEQLGTANALNTTLSLIPPSTQNILVLNGDDSFTLTPAVIKNLYTKHLQNHAALSFTTTTLASPAGLGRILRDGNGDVSGIVEEKDASEDQKQLKEVNTGCYVFSLLFLKQYLKQVPPSPTTGEYYLTDLIRLAVTNKQKITTLALTDFKWQGVNTLEELQQAHQKKAYLVDLDNTLINTDKLNHDIEETILKQYGTQITSGQIQQIYEKIRTTAGVIKIPEIAKELASLLGIASSDDIENIFTHMPFNNYLFPESINLLQQLNSRGTVYIVSQGDELFQRTKIKNTDISKIIDQTNILISKDKPLFLSTFIPDLIKQNYHGIYVIDDKLELLQAAKKLSGIVETVWVKYGKYAEIDSRDSLVDLSVNSLADVLTYLADEKVGSILDQNQEYLIKFGLNKNLIKQIIEYAHTDTEVQKNTADLNRFKDQIAFNNWLPIRKRFFYTLADHKDTLMALLWIDEKTHSNLNNYPLTFAIRMYPPVRGKGLAQEFVEKAFAHFKKTGFYSKLAKKGIWLTTSTNNIAGQKLYQNLKFKPVSESKGQVLMCLEEF